MNYLEILYIIITTNHKTSNTKYNKIINSNFNKLRCMADDLRNIYNLCNPDSNDCILTSVLVEKLQQQFDPDHLLKIQQTIDPSKKGKINYQDFCEAITNLSYQEQRFEKIDVNLRAYLEVYHFF